MDDNNNLIKVRHKWGFGMSPFSHSRNTIYKESFTIMLDLLAGIRGIEEQQINFLSETKGAFNRCIKKDQWDWFTMYYKLGRPSFRDMTSIVSLLSTFRNAMKNGSDVPQKITHQLKCKNLDFYLKCFLGTADPISSESLYIISNKKDPNLLKIGMTTRDVFTRIKEINSGTGVVYPYSVRALFDVKNSKYAEKIAHNALRNFRIRSDREFFNINFSQAVQMVEDELEASPHINRHYGSVYKPKNSDTCHIECTDDGCKFSTLKAYAHVSANVADGDNVSFRVGRESETTFRAFDIRPHCRTQGRRNILINQTK